MPRTNTLLQRREIYVASVGHLRVACGIVPYDFRDVLVSQGELWELWVGVGLKPIAWKDVGLYVHISDGLSTARGVSVLDPHIAGSLVHGQTFGRQDRDGCHI